MIKAENKFGTGAVKDRPDNRDYQWADVAFGAAPFDWNTGYDVETTLAVSFKAKDQDGSGSCGGQAFSYYDASVELASSKTYEERSARYLYSQTYVQGGGSAGRDLCNILKGQGCAEEKNFTSYDNGAAPTETFMEKNSDITEAIRQGARSGIILSYANVSPDIDSVAQAIRENFGVVIGITGSNNGTWNSIYPAGPSGDSRWYHWVYAGKAKMIGGKKHIGIINSWGTAVGDKGWQWLSEDYFNTLTPNDAHGPKAVWQCWTMVFNANPPTPGYHHTFKKDLVYLMVDPEVVELQKALQLEGCFPMSLPTNPRYGDVTMASVKKFQVKYGIAALGSNGYGRCGPKTREKLNALYGG